MSTDLAGATVSVSRPRFSTSWGDTGLAESAHQGGSRSPPRIIDSTLVPTGPLDALTA